jgi:acetolactate synthase-1/2/3 large subunit
VNVADNIVKILEEEGISEVFGIPGEQIMPLYRSLSESGIDHVLARHEQAAAHAADGYARSTGKIGVCVTTASPGALNTVMAVATAFKDNLPVLILTGDNELKYRGSDHFQTTPQVEIFKHITQASYNPLNGTEAMYMLRASIYELKNFPKGPIHINLSKDILLQEEFEDFDLCYLCEDDMSNLSGAQEAIDKSEKPLIILGAGAIGESENIEMIVGEYEIPVMTTFPAPICCKRSASSDSSRSQTVSRYGTPDRMHASVRFGVMMVDSGSSFRISSQSAVSTVA